LHCEFVGFARAVNPNHEWIEDYNDYFEDIKDLDEYVKAFVKLGQISQRLYPKTLNKLAEAVPEELQDQEILRDFKWRYTKPKVWSSNSIVYFCSSAFEDWDASSLKTGCGGSEEAVIHLTKRWVEMGYEVTVYNNCKTEGIVDGVNWVRYEKFNPRDLFNVIISWRNNLFAAYNVVAKHKIIDMHDVPSGPYYTLDNLKGVDLFVKSDYHKSLFNLPDDKFTIIPNGIEVDKFKGGDKVKNSVLWTSSYDRGLENLLTIWPDVIKEVPDATLDVYYGFNLFDSMPQGKSKEGKLWKQKMLKLLDQPGVKEHGRVGSETIIEATKKADVFAYPTDFPEISCITAMKMQAGGAIPITSGFAALKETILFPEPTIDITNENGLNIYKEKLINILKLSRDEKSNLRTAMKKIDKFDWNTIAERWIGGLK
jgi:glycosyltransferase involved in cell wall biosynthesis